MPFIFPFYSSRCSFLGLWQSAFQPAKKSLSFCFNSLFNPFLQSCCSSTSWSLFALGCGSARCVLSVLFFLLSHHLVLSRRLLFPPFHSLWIFFFVAVRLCSLIKSACEFSLKYLYLVSASSSSQLFFSLFVVSSSHSFSLLYRSVPQLLSFLCL